MALVRSLRRYLLTPNLAPGSCSASAHTAGTVDTKDINVLEGAAESGRVLRIQGYDDDGFTVSGTYLPSSLFLMGGMVLRWRPTTMAEVTPQSLVLLDLIHPRPELLLLGCGKSMQQVTPELRAFLRQQNIKLEPVATWNAMTTYNFLVEEGRQVAAALLPSAAL